MQIAKYPIVPVWEVGGALENVGREETWPKVGDQADL